MSTNTTRKFRINRKKWLRGYVYLRANKLWLKEQNAGCCLGHVTRQMTHCSWDSLHNVSYPPLSVQRKIINDSSLTERDERVKEIADINDSSMLNDAKIEKALIAEFAKYNIEIQFYN